VVNCNPIAEPASVEMLRRWGQGRLMRLSWQSSGRLLASETEKWAKTVKFAGIKAE
jgi:hypothetical protein